jgi:hypothetical protein
VNVVVRRGCASRTNVSTRSNAPMNACLSEARLRLRCGGVNGNVDASEQGDKILHFVLSEI